VYADWGIRCNVIQPGWIETDLTARMSSNPLVKKMQSKVMNNTVLLRRSGRAEEIAFTALFLASDETVTWLARFSSFQPIRTVSPYRSLWMLCGRAPVKMPTRIQRAHRR